MQLDLFAEHDGLSGKMSPAHLAANTAKTLQQWLEKWQVASHLSQKKAGGERGWQLAQTVSLSGLCLTRNGSEWRSVAAVCSLSSILETGNVGHQYYLSQKACDGILRRAEARGKKLPSALQEALVSGSTQRGLQQPHTASTPTA